MLTAVVSMDRAPYRTVLTHGFVVNEHGQPYSKSLKNYLPPEKVIKSKGAELFRLWAAYVDYRNDMPFSDALLGQLGDSYRKIRNTARFLLGNLKDHDPDRAIDPATRSTLDRWALDRLSWLNVRCRKAYEEFEFHQVYRSLIEFCTVDMSAFYLDVIKDRLYCEAPNDPGRRATQQVLHLVARDLCALMAPVLCFTAEDIWSHLPRQTGEPDSVHLAQFGEAQPQDLELTRLVEGLRGLREIVLKELEPFRAQKHHSLDAHVLLELDDADRELVAGYGAQDLADLFIVSSVELRPGPQNKATITEAGGVKCPRCWKRSTGTGDPRGADLCPRCASVLDHMGVEA